MEDGSELIVENMRFLSELGDASFKDLTMSSTKTRWTQRKRRADYRAVVSG